MQLVTLVVPHNARQKNVESYSSRHNMFCTNNLLHVILSSYNDSIVYIKIQWGKLENRYLLIHVKTPKNIQVILRAK